MLQPMKLLSDVIEAQQPQGDAHALKHIRAIGFNEEYYTADALDMLARLSDGSYSGLSAEDCPAKTRYRYWKAPLLCIPSTTRTQWMH